MKKISVLMCIFSGLLISCATPKSGSLTEQESSTGPAPGETGPNILHQEEAKTRAKQVHKVAYRLWFGLNNEDGSDQGFFEGRATIQFKLREKAKEAGSDLFLDFEEGEIKTLKLNETLLEAKKGYEYDGHRITFKIRDLKPGANEIQIAFRHKYSKSGDGLHRFKDPEDQKTYLYTNFEPFDAHQLFPCFDQPDLKATFDLSALVPDDWVVISNSPDTEKQKTDGRVLWQFSKSPLMSTYLFALHAGPYAEFKSVAKTKSGDIPMRLFSRQTLKKYVDFKDWFDITARGLEFYGEEFEYPYPFIKYDQVIVPEFNPGAMENIAAVTFSERFVYRSKVTNDTKKRRADTILHEMAHMWFGDLVTMRWWNGLWLNETFATYMSNVSMDKSSTYKNIWESFNGEKTWAYWTDQLVTTHSIEGPVPNTDAANSIFDGITYGKGAAVLKQLNFLLGEADFKEGVRRYFKKHAYKNTSISDFISALAEASDKDLVTWQREWLQTPGTNTLSLKWTCDPQSKKISEAHLLQGAALTDHPTLRQHRTQLGLYSLNKNGVPHRLKTIDITYAGSKTEAKGLVGEKCPAFIFTNEGDYDYVKLELSEEEFAFVRKHLSRFESALTRQVLWQALWEGVIDGNFSAKEFAATVFEHAPHEKLTELLTTLLDRMAKVSGFSGHSVYKILEGTSRSEFKKHFSAWTFEELKKAAPGSDMQLIWFQNWLKVLHEPSDVTLALKLLDGKEKISGLKIETDRRWEILSALSRAGAPTPEIAAARIEEESKKDGSDQGLRSALAARVQAPSKENKILWFKQFSEAKDSNGRPLSGGRVRAALQAFHQIGQEDLTREVAEAYFSRILEFSKDRKLLDESYRGRFASSIFPALCSQEIADRTTTLLKNDLSNLEVSIVKTLKVGRQEEERCVRARIKAGR